MLLQTFDPRDGRVHTSETESGRLSTDRCFEHLFLHQRATIFGYGLGYDISNWLADLSRDVLAHLLARGYVRWKHWKLDYIPGKCLKVCDRTREEGDRQRVVYDLCPFFQRPFITALEEAKLEVPDIIRQGKRLRGRFVRANNEFVRAYNEAELCSMAALHNVLITTLKAGDCRIRYWFGPGSCARYEANRQQVTVSDDQLKLFLGARRDLKTAGLESVEQIAAREQSPHACVADAFYGGRFELSQHGPIDACWEYDLASAYPWALSQGMPCFACGGEWKEGDGSDWVSSEGYNSVWLVSWRPREGRAPMWGPFPKRLTRNLAWTREGWGWYHGVEVQAAHHYMSDQYDFTVHKRWWWCPYCDHDPWSWVGAVAEERVAIKHTDPSRAQCLKLTLNSLYGITADKAGVDNGRIPRYHNPYWAGLITARTRARLIEAAAIGGEDIVYLATDGVHSKRPLNLACGNSLGDWEAPSRSGVPAVFLAPGTYLYEDGKRGKSRGVNLGKFSDQIATWRRLYRMTAPNGQIALREHHFTSAREALSRSLKQPPERYEETVNTWSDRERILSYDLSPRREKREDGRWVAPGLQYWLSMGQVLLTPNDRRIADEERWSSDQPEWSAHKLDSCQD